MEKRTKLEIILIITNIVIALIAVVAILRIFRDKIINAIVPPVTIEDDDDLEFESDGKGIWANDETIEEEVLE